MRFSRLFDYTDNLDSQSLIREFAVRILIVSFIFIVFQMNINKENTELPHIDLEETEHIEQLVSMFALNHKYQFRVSRKYG